MASLPQRQPSQPPRAAPEQSSNPQSQAQASSSPVRTRSEDSQTLFLNKADEEEATAPAQDSQQEPVPQDTPELDSDKKCWICFSDSAEDTPETSPWRSPCPCNLVAHEACLLDWIADMESPSNHRRNDSLAGPRIECPQCKSEIQLARPRNLVVDAVRGIERLGGQLVTPGALTVLLGSVYHSSMAWGVQNIYAVFGAEDGYRILAPLVMNNVRAPIETVRGMTRKEISDRILEAALVHLQHWRLYVGVPLIAPMLVLSRTSLADSVLPVLPIVFFATQNHSSHDPIEFGTWPPSAGMAFATLPYLRSAYNYYYKRVWAPKERQWLKEIQPRLTQDAANGEGGNGQQDANGEHGMGARDDDENVFEVRIDGDIWEDWGDDDANDEDGMPPPNLQPQDGQAAQQPADANVDPNQIPQVNQNPQVQQPVPAPGGERRLSFSPTAIAETVLGALMFPAIAGVSGELLKLWLPSSWTSPVYYRQPLLGPFGTRKLAKGLLAEKWGRSLVGGCLFVVLKDAVMLYVKFKMAEMHRKRRVVDWKGDRRGRT